MYEARQNKEKVSRVIDSTGLGRQYIKMETLGKSKISNMVLQRMFSFSFLTLSNHEILSLIKTMIPDLDLKEDNIIEKIEKMRNGRNYYISIQSIIKELYPNINIKSVNDNIINTQIETLKSKKPDPANLYRRSDTRNLKELEGYKGFFAKSPMSLEHVRLLVKKLYTKRNKTDANKFEFNVTVGERECCVCTSFYDKEYTYSTGKTYIISLPSDFIKRNPQTCLNIKREDMVQDIENQPSLYMDSNNIDNATIIGLAPSSDNNVELTFLTGIPMQFISAEKPEDQEINDDSPSEMLDTPSLLSLPLPPPPPPPPPPTNLRK